MHIKDQQLTVQLNRDIAIVTVAFTVILDDTDLGLIGGFSELVILSSPLSTFLQMGNLPMDAAVKPNPHATYKELYRKQTFHVPRYPNGPFKTVKFHSQIKISPNIRKHDEQITNEGVLPAKYSLWVPLTALLQALRRLGT